MTAALIAGFGLTTANAARLIEFYENAFGARHHTCERVAGPALERLTGVDGSAERHVLSVGNERVELLQFDHAGAPYPHPVSPYDLFFQHLALVVGDMRHALAQLSRVPGWTPLSTAGAEVLPISSGGVTAFKFQDPDGHPLELLAFPPDAIPAPWREPLRDSLIAGIDHTAISVADTQHSMAFYESFGFRMTARTVNEGKEQARLDGIANPQVEVTALAARLPVPHLEFLCYRTKAIRKPRALRGNDVAATRIILQADPDSRITAAPALDRFIVDPDGHHLQIAVASR